MAGDGATSVEIGAHEKGRSSEDKPPCAHPQLQHHRHRDAHASTSAASDDPLAQQQSAIRPPPLGCPHAPPRQNLLDQAPPARAPRLDHPVAPAAEQTHQTAVETTARTAQLSCTEAQHQDLQQRDPAEQPSLAPPPPTGRPKFKEALGEPSKEPPEPGLLATAFTANGAVISPARPGPSAPAASPPPIHPTIPAAPIAPIAAPGAQTTSAPPPPPPPPRDLPPAPQDPQALQLGVDDQPAVDHSSSLLKSPSPPARPAAGPLSDLPSDLHSDWHWHLHQQQHPHHPPHPSLPKMQFSDLYKSPKSPWSKLRHHSLQLQQPNSDQLPQQQQRRHSQGPKQPAQTQQGEPPPSATEQDYGDPDLVSRDKSKQKEAVRRFLAENIRYDWVFNWPAQEAAAARAAEKAAKAAELLKQRPLDPASTFGSPMPVPLAQVVAAAAAAGGKKNSSSGNDDTAVDDSGAEADSETESVYSTVSEDQEHFRARAEWTSDVSDDEPVVQPIATGNPMISGVVALSSPFRFDSPDSVGVTIQASAQARKTKVRRDQRAEMAWNQGLACFTARRDAWTGARTVRVKTKVVTPPAQPSPASPRRGLFRIRSNNKADPAPAVAISTAVEAQPRTHDDPSTSTTTPTAPAGTTPGTTPATTAAAGTANTAVPTAAPLSPVTSNSRNSQHSQHSLQSAGHDTMATTPATSDIGGENSLRRSTSSQAAAATTAAGACSIPPPPTTHTQYAVETLIPVAPPLLPPANPMRASITPSIYLSLYDKVVLHSLQPSCPINLQDMMRSCVSGWKRDGEWPPRAVEVTPAAAMAVARKKRRDDRRAEARKDRRDSSGPASPGFGRRMSNLLSRQPSHPNPTATTATGGTAAQGGASGASAAGGTGGSAAEAEDGVGGSHGIRRSLQRVLGLGHAHGHSQSVGSVGEVKEG